MEDGHLAAFGSFLDGGFCHNRRFTLFILIIIVIMQFARIIGRGVSTGHPLIGNRCGIPVLRKGAGLAELGAAAGAEVRCMREFLATVVTELGGCCRYLHLVNVRFLPGFLHNRPTRGSGAFLLRFRRNSAPDRPGVLLLERPHGTLHCHFHGRLHFGFWYRLEIRLFGRGDLAVIDWCDNRSTRGFCYLPDLRFPYRRLDNDIRFRCRFRFRHVIHGEESLHRGLLLKILGGFPGRAEFWFLHGSSWRENGRLFFWLFRFTYLFGRSFLWFLFGFFFLD